jgi:hypothetical protein
MNQPQIIRLRGDAPDLVGLTIGLRHASTGAPSSGA